MPPTEVTIRDGTEQVVIIEGNPINARFSMNIDRQYMDLPQIKETGAPFLVRIALGSNSMSQVLTPAAAKEALMAAYNWVLRAEQGE